MPKRGRSSTEPRVAVRKCAKHMVWRKLGSGAKALQGATFPLGELKSHNSVKFSFLLLRLKQLNINSRLDDGLSY